MDEGEVTALTLIEKIRVAKMNIVDLKQKLEDEKRFLSKCESNLRVVLDYAIFEHLEVGTGDHLRDIATLFHGIDAVDAVLPQYEAFARELVGKKGELVLLIHHDFGYRPVGHGGKTLDSDAEENYRLRVGILGAEELIFLKHPNCQERYVTIQVPRYVSIDVGPGKSLDGGFEIKDNIFHGCGDGQYRNPLDVYHLMQGDTDWRGHIIIGDALVMAKCAEFGVSELLESAGCFLGKPMPLVLQPTD